MCDSSEVGMKIEHKKAIQKNFKTLVDNCNIDLLLPELLKRNVFTDEMIKKYKGPNKLENKRKLFMDIDRRGPDAFQNLVDSLTDIGQQHLAKNLTSNLVNVTDPIEINGAIPFKLPTNPDAKIDNDKVVEMLTKQMNVNVEQPLEIKVTPSSRFYCEDLKSLTYQTISQNRGKALIINNIIFNTEYDRQGAECDGISLQLLFKQIGLNVEYHENKPGKEMIEIIANFARSDDLKDTDMAVVVISSHGHQSENGESFLKGTDNGKVPNSWIESQFNNINCKNLKKKAKIFIYQACRGDNNDYVFSQQDRENVGLPNFSPSNYTDRAYSDMLIVHSTLPGYKSHRDVYTGSWYIQHLCKIFMEHAHDTDVERLLKMVDKELMELKSSEGSLQTATYQSVGFKICYLHPGIYKQDGEIKYFSHS